MRMKHTHYSSMIVWLARLTFVLAIALVVGPAWARDLDAGSDGEHLWLVLEDPAPKEKGKPGLLIYHMSDQPDEPARGRMIRLEPIKGELMPRGLAVGDGRLMMVMTDREIQTVRSAWSQVQLRWETERRELPALPKDCVLVSLVVDNRGPWALVRVEAQAVLDELDRVEDKPNPSDLDKVLLNRALGLPDHFELNPTKPSSEDAEKKDTGEMVEDEPTETPDPDADVDADTDPDPPAGEIDAQRDENETTTEPAEPRTPAYRLIYLKADRWVSAPLPEGFAADRHAELVLMPENDRPSIIVQSGPAEASTGELRWFTPINPIGSGDAEASQSNSEAGLSIESDAWLARTVQLPPGRTLGQWSATLMDRHIVVCSERSRSKQSLSVELYQVRGEEVNTIGRVNLPTDGSAIWSAMPWQGAVGVVAQPGPKLQNPADGSEPAQPLAGLIAMDRNGEIVTGSGENKGIIPLIERTPSRWEGNADIFIQMGAFVIAMVMMVLFYRRAPRGDQLVLPERVVLATFGRRIIAGTIDLVPGFLLAGLLFDVSLNETMRYWPGNGLPKALPAMRPGFVVIGVTVMHTTIFEFIFARSIGKWVTGLYVADLSGKPAPPVPSLIRAASRVFDLFAPLMLILAVISPGRQRLGDILARTLVVMQLPEEREEDETNHDEY